MARRPVRPRRRRAPALRPGSGALLPALALAGLALAGLAAAGCRQVPGETRPGDAGAAGGPLPPSFEPVVFPRTDLRAGEDPPEPADLRAPRHVQEEDAGWAEKWALASRYAQGGFDDEAVAVVEATLAAGPPPPWAARLEGLRQAIRMREAAEVLRVDVRGVRDYVAFGAEVAWVVRLRNVSPEEIVVAAPGTATAPDGTPLSPAALALEVTRRDVDIYTSELRRTWTQPVALQRPGEGEIRIPPGGSHEVRTRIPAEEAGGPLSGLRIFEVGGVLRPSGLRVGPREVAEPLRLRAGRVVALPAGFEPLAAHPLESLDRAVSAVLPVHVLVASEFVPRDGRTRLAEALARALAEGDRALRTSVLSSVALLRERAVGEPLAPLAAPFVGHLARTPERADDLMEALHVLTGRVVAPDPRLWNEWWRREQAAGGVVPEPGFREAR